MPARGATGVVAPQDRGSPEPQPAEDPEHALERDAVAGSHDDHAAGGDYDLSPFADVALPAARVTVPDGWNAAQWGPDRFAGMGPAGPATSRRRGNRAWYAALVVLEVVASQERLRCGPSSGHDTAEVLAALAELPRQEVTRSGRRPGSVVPPST